MNPLKKIVEFAKRDSRNVTRNVISMVVCAGMIVVPCFYAWFNIAASWDPYSNTKNLKIAVVNNDEGYSSDLVPVSLNVGERITSDLRASKSIGYVVTNEEDALDGVSSGEYYAAIVIPEAFSHDMMTVLSDPDDKPSVTFYQNEKQNSIASIVTDKASNAVKQDIDSSFAESVTNVGASILDDFGTYMSDDQVTAFASKLDVAILDSTSSLHASAKDMRAYASILGSARNLLGSSSGAFDTSLSATLDAASMLRDSADGVREIGSAVDGTTDSINDTLQKGSSSLDDVQAALDKAFEAANGQTDDLKAALAKAKKTVDGRIDELSDIKSKLDALDSSIGDLEGNLTEGSLVRDRVHELRVDIQGLSDRVGSAISEMQELSDELQKTIDDIDASVSDATAARKELAGLVADAKSGMSAVRDDYEKDLKGSLSTLAGHIESAAGTTESISGDLKSTLASVDETVDAASKGIEGMEQSLSKAADKLEKAADDLDALHDKLTGALNSGDVKQIRDVLSSDPASLASFISEPVTIDRTAVYPCDNNGSAMAPFYTTLAIWIGGVILAALVKVGPSERRQKELACTPGQSYLGRIIFFLLLGLMQSSVIVLGDLYFLGIQCAHPLLFILIGWVSSFAFVNIIFALTASFGDVGKAIAVILMVIQVAGSGGSFPKQMLPGAFQVVYPFLPFVHAENAMRSAMFGIYNGDFWQELLMLLAYVVPALLLGLVLRKPIIRLNEWIEHKLEETKIM